MSLDFPNAFLGASAGILLTYIIYALKRGIIQTYLKYFKYDSIKGLWYHYYTTIEDGKSQIHTSVIIIEAGFFHNYSTKSYFYKDEIKKTVEKIAPSFTQKSNQTAKGYIDSFNNHLQLTTTSLRFNETAHIVFQRQLKENRDDIVMIGFSHALDSNGHIISGKNILSAKSLSKKEIKKYLEKSKKKVENCTKKI